MKKILAFIDESGDPLFNKDASSHLEFSAILIEADNEQKTINELKTLQRKLGISEYKSNAIRSEHRRIQILNEIQDIDFKFINLSIDKSKIIGNWKNYPKTFYKFSQKLLNSELHRLYPERNVTIDKYGDEQFQISLKNYLTNETQMTLFDNTINIGSAKNNELIQLADLISGTHRKLIKNDFKSSEIIDNLLQSKALHILSWPQNFNNSIISSIDNQQDKLVAEKAINYAERYISKINEQPKKLVLDYLLFQVKFVDSSKYIYSTELIDWLNQNGYLYSEEEFRKEIIGALRDDGVVIAGSNKGLKIPVSLTELTDYLNFASSRFITMIRRFHETYKTLNASSLGEIGIFNSQAFNKHKEFFKILDKY